MSKTRPIARLLSVSALASEWHCSRKVARSWLRHLNKLTDGQTIIRFGSGRTSAEYTTRSLLAKADTRLLEEQEMLRSDVDELKAKEVRNHAEIQRLRARVRVLEEDR